jgi:hypothetical protein
MGLQHKLFKMFLEAIRFPPRLEREEDGKRGAAMTQPKKRWFLEKPEMAGE